METAFGLNACANLDGQASIVATRRALATAQIAADVLKVSAFVQVDSWDERVKLSCVRMAVQDMGDAMESLANASVSLDTAASIALNQHAPTVRTAVHVEVKISLQRACAKLALRDQRARIRRVIHRVLRTVASAEVESVCAQQASLASNARRRLRYARRIAATKESVKNSREPVVATMDTRVWIAPFQSAQRVAMNRMVVALTVRASALPVLAETIVLRRGAQTTALETAAVTSILLSATVIQAGLAKIVELERAPAL